MRLLLVGAFSFPHPLGSPVYLREQALALRDAGADVHLLTYGPPPVAVGSIALDPGAERNVDPDPELDGIELHTLPAWTRPASRRSGPSLGKPLADLALAATLRRIVASSAGSSVGWSVGSSAASSTATSVASSSASRAASSTARNELRRASKNARGAARSGFDAILAHHAEAALAALELLPRPRPPIVYCAHTLLGEELPEYLKLPRSRNFPGTKGRAEDAGEPPMTQAWPRRALAATGRVIDRALARRAEAWITLTQSATRVIEAATDRPGRCIAPPVRDLSKDLGPADGEAIARTFGLLPDGYFVYAGNLDPYQDLPLLERVARARQATQAASAAQAGKGNAFPIVVATHDEAARAGERSSGRTEGRPTNGLRRVHVRSASEANALVSAARASIVPRRSVGGFPIKLLNSLALGVPVVAFHGEEWGLDDGANAIVCGLERPEASLLAALSLLESDAGLARRLGRGARATWLARHQPERVAADTLDLIAKLG